MATLQVLSGRCRSDSFTTGDRCGVSFVAGDKFDAAKAFRGREFCERTRHGDE
jgi:hypothetical protein